MTVAFGEM